MAFAYKKTEEDLITGKVYAKVGDLMDQAHGRVAGLLIGFNSVVRNDSEFARIFGR